MILDMIQGCRYLRRSTDRWFLSKNSTTRLKDSKVGTGPFCCEIVRSLLQTLRVHIYTLVLTRLLVVHEYNIYCLNWCPSANVRLAPVINLFLPYIQATSSRIPECFLVQAQNSPSAEWWRAPDRRHLYRMLWGKFPVEWCFLTKLDPQVSLFPAPIFGVNICPFSYGIKSDFIPELTINAQRLQTESVQHPFFDPSNHWSFHPDPNPSSSILQSQIFKWRTKTRLFR
jgi:hypothetical protein